MNLKVKLKTRKNLIVFIIGICLIIFCISKIYAFYYQVSKSPIKTTFKLNAPTTNNGYLRAYVYTYWIDTKSNEIAGKNSWTLSDDFINQVNWKKIGDYYYYNGIVNLDISKEKLPRLVTIASNNLVHDDNYKASYKVIYEIMEAVSDDSGKTSSYYTWHTYYINDCWNQVS